MTTTSQRHPVRTALWVLVAIVGITFSVLACGFILLLFIARVGGGFRPPETTEELTQAVVDSSLLVVRSVLWTLLGVAAAAITAAIAIRTRRTSMMRVSVVCGSLFALTLLFVLLQGASTVERLSQRTMAAVREDSAVPPPAPPTLTAQESCIAAAQMLTATFDAAVDPIVDAEGKPLNLDAMVPTEEACATPDARFSTSFDFSTGDNARTLENVLATWDEAGYAKDRAGQQDIRYSETLPIERMTIRDQTTMDGLIHMQISIR